MVIDELSRQVPLYQDSVLSIGVIVGIPEILEGSFAISFLVYTIDVELHGVDVACFCLDSDPT